MPTHKYSCGMELNSVEIYHNRVCLVMRVPQWRSNIAEDGRNLASMRVVGGLEILDFLAVI